MQFFYLFNRKQILFNTNRCLSIFNYFQKCKKCSYFYFSDQEKEIKSASLLIDAEAEDCLLWLQNNSEPFITAKEYWGKTIIQRKVMNNGTIHEYFNKFLCLKLPLGYTLVRKLKLAFNFCIY